MNDKPNLAISIISLVSAVVMLLALSLAIGKWSFSSHTHTVKVVFPSVGGIDVNSPVKLAGAVVGRVTSIHLLPKADRSTDPVTGSYNFVSVTAEIDSDVDICNDYTSQVKQDGLGLSPKYLLFMPGKDHDAPPLVDGGIIQGQQTFELTDLAPQIGTALAKANHLLDEAGDDLSKIQPLADKLGPLADKLAPLADDLGNRLPPLLDNTEKLIDHTSDIVESLDTPATRAHLTKTLANLVVVTDNLKVVSSNSKALTATLADKPWRLLFGGKTIEPPSEEEVLDSNKTVPLKGEVRVEEQTKPVDVTPKPAHLVKPRVPLPTPAETPTPRP
jgi:ABC-type transporter Mla subunit MlaD